MSIIKLIDVTYTYPLSEEPSLKDVTISFEKGKFYSIIGSNGSGKTTLANIIRGFIPSFYQGQLDGEVYLNDKYLSEYSSGDLAEKIGYVFQNPFNQITGSRDSVFEEIAYGLENLGVQRDKIAEKVNSVMELTNISELKDKNPFELSGGQQQRVALASIIVLDPPVLVIDEPTSQLDPLETDRIFSIINQMKEAGKTIILIEHKMEQVATFSDYIFVLENGRIISQGKKHEVLSDISLLDHGVMLPKAVTLSHQLNEAGIQISKKIVTNEEIQTVLTSILEGGGQHV